MPRFRSYTLGRPAPSCRTCVLAFGAPSFTLGLILLIAEELSRGPSDESRPTLLGLSGFAVIVGFFLMITFLYCTHCTRTDDYTLDETRRSALIPTPPPLYSSSDNVSHEPCIRGAPVNNISPRIHTESEVFESPKSPHLLTCPWGQK